MASGPAWTRCPVARRCCTSRAEPSETITRSGAAGPSPGGTAECDGRRDRTSAGGIRGVAPDADCWVGTSSSSRPPRPTRAELRPRTWRVGATLERASSRRQPGTIKNRGASTTLRGYRGTNLACGKLSGAVARVRRPYKMQGCTDLSAAFARPRSVQVDCPHLWTGLWMPRTETHDGGQQRNDPLAEGLWTTR